MAEKEATQVEGIGPSGDIPALTKAFLNAGWALSHAIANERICQDRTCYRCQLADLLFETEERLKV